MSGVTARIARCLVALSLCAAGAAGCAGTPGAATVTIVIPWAPGTAEYKAFQSVIYPWKQKTGVKVDEEISRAPAEQLDIDRATGDIPDLVDMPSPVALDQFMGHGLEPLTGIDLSSYDQPWRSLAELGTHTVYAVPVKADIKSLIWYHTGVPKTVLSSWAALRNFSSHGTPWCLGLNSGTASGWPGADWVADILLSSNTVGTYEKWLDGKLPWTSSKVASAWQAWGALMGYGTAIDGRALGALETSFDKAGSGMKSGRCELEHGALSATSLPSTDVYSYVPFPSMSGASSGPIMVSGDFMGLFTGNANAKALLAYLATTKAQKLWVRQRGYAFSADHDVKPGAYRYNVQRRIADLFLPAHDSAMLCFGADDMLTTDMSTAFEQTVLRYISDHKSLPKLLEDLQTAQKGFGHSPLALAKIGCARNN